MAGRVEMRAGGIEARAAGPLVVDVEATNAARQAIVEEMRRDPETLIGGEAGGRRGISTTVPTSLPRTS